MTLSEFQTLLNNTIFLLNYENLLCKNWIYKDKINVLDFEYKRVKFAFDFIFKEEALISVYLLNRNNDIGLLRKKIDKRVLLDSINIDDISYFLKNNIQEVLNLIDSNYKYDVSVIVPVYNRQNLIKKCINSLNCQTLDKSRFEVIFVDDCSSDNTVKVIEELCFQNLNFSILKRPIGSGNASAPRNDGLRKAKGRYVFFLDSDDYISVDCLEFVLGFADDTNSDVTYIKMGTDPENPRQSIPIRAFKKGTVRKASIAKNNLLRSSSACKFYKRDFLIKNRILYDQSLPLREDKLHNIQVLSKTNNISIMADKDFIFITSHDGEHLSKVNHELSLEVMIYLNGYNWIYTSDLNFQHKLELFNAWTIILMERLESIIKSKKYNENEKMDFFNNSLIIFKGDPFYLSEKYIYVNLRKYIDAIRAKDYYAFSALVLEGA